MPPKRGQSILITHPDLCKEWDYKRNKVDPDDFTKSNHTKVWWICSKNSHHSWDADISSRARLNSGCPICTNQRICECGCNSFANKYPEIAKDWDNTQNKKSPKQYSPTSGKKVWWICSKDSHHKWDDTISHRGLGKRGCPICSNYRICECGCNSFAKRHPKLLKEWDYSKNAKSPEEVPYASKYKAWWICSKDNHHKWSAFVESRTSKNTGCPICTNRIICECKCNSFAKRFPKLLTEWDYERNPKPPDEYTYRSTKKVWWICQKNKEHRWRTAVLYRTHPKQLTQCPKCNLRSQGEDRITKHLDYLNIEYIPEKRFDDCKYKHRLPFDVFIPDLNILIEFDGVHHFYKGRYYDDDFIIRDLIKTIYGSENYYFLRISHEEILDVENIIETFVLWVMDDDIDYGYYSNILNKELTFNVQSVYELHDQVSDDNIDEIQKAIFNIIKR